MRDIKINSKTSLMDCTQERFKCASYQSIQCPTKEMHVLKFQYLSNLPPLSDTFNKLKVGFVLKRRDQNYKLMIGLLGMK